MVAGEGREILERSIRVITPTLTTRLVSRARAPMMEPADGVEENPWDAEHARVLSSFEANTTTSTTTASAEASVAEAAADPDAPWICGICGRKNRPAAAKCGTCSAVRGRKPNPKIVNYVSKKEERSRSASIDVRSSSKDKVCSGPLTSNPLPDPSNAQPPSTIHVLLSTRTKQSQKRPPP